VSEFTEYRLRALGGWLLRKKHSDEYCETNLLKVAVSVEDATNTLNMSKRVPRAIKSLIWEMSEEHGQSLDYNKEELETFSDMYRDEILESVPNDLEPGDKAQSIQWLTSLGSNDKSFARKTLLAALVDLELTRGSLLYKIKTNLESKKEEFESPRGIYRDSVVIKNKLERFFNWKRFMSIRDLMLIKSLEQFFKVVDDAELGIKEYSKNKEYLDAEAGTEILDQSDAWIAYVIKNKGAACEKGSETDWCTAAPGGNWFGTYYHESDPLFIIEHKRDKDERFQVHFGTEQFKDTGDHEVAPVDRANLIDILNNFGSNKYLSSQLYNSFLSFKHRDRSASGETEMEDLYPKLVSYMNEVIREKIEEGSLEDPDMWLPSKILDQVSSQITEDDSIMAYDSRASDLAGQIMADYSPTEFFELSLDVDYPELAINILKKAINADSQRKNTWAESVAPLDLYQSFMSGTLFQSDSVHDFLKESDETRKQLVDKIVATNGLDILLGAGSVFEFANEAADIIKEFRPTLRSDVAKSLQVKDTGESSHPFLIQTAEGKTAGLALLIKSSFYSQFPEEFKRIMDAIMATMSNHKNPKGTAWWAQTALDAMSEANIVQRYFNYYIAFLSFGLKTDFDAFSKYEGPNLPEAMKDKLSGMKTEEEATYVKSLVSNTDRVILGWRNRELDGETLYEIFSAVEGSDLNALKERTRYKPIVEFYNKMLSILRRKIAEKANTQGAKNRTKIELPRELLLYVATLLPGLWSTYNLEYKVVVPSEITAKAHRSMKELERKIQEEGEREHTVEEEEQADEEDWDDEDDF
jgi:hypothetical protein